jgi:hypothetical protein
MSRRAPKSGFEPRWPLAVTVLAVLFLLVSLPDRIDRRNDDVSQAPVAFHLLAKPTGATCNLDCKYCFFLSKGSLYPSRPGSHRGNPILHGGRYKFGPIIRPNVCGNATEREQVCQDVDDVCT